MKGELHGKTHRKPWIISQYRRTNSELCAPHIMNLASSPFQLKCIVRAQVSEIGISNGSIHSLPVNYSCMIGRIFIFQGLNDGEKTKPRQKRHTTNYPSEREDYRMKIIQLVQTHCKMHWKFIILLKKFNV